MPLAVCVDSECYSYCASKYQHCVSNLVSFCMLLISSLETREFIYFYVGETLSSQRQLKLIFKSYSVVTLCLDKYCICAQC